MELLTITQPPVLNASATSTHLTCFLSGNGTASVTASGGTPSYTYSWSPSGGTAATATGLSAGMYTVTVTDAKGCTKTATVVVTQPTQLLATIGTPTHVNCNGGTNGSATVTASGSTPAYTYSWNTNPVQTTATASNLGAGTYTVTVTDSKGCTKTASVTITQPPVLNATALKTNVTCNGAADGTATVTASGGTPAYTYSWNTTPVQTTPMITGLVPGTYTVTVTDAKGCIKTASVTITQPPMINLMVDTLGISCTGTADGMIFASAVAGATITVNGQPYNENTLYGPGVYTVVATIPGGNAGNLPCTQQVVVSLTNPAPVTATVVVTNAQCFGQMGTITVTPSAGAMIFVDGMNKAAGTHSYPVGPHLVEVMKMNAQFSGFCIYDTTVIITQPPVLNASAAPTHVLCFGGTGSATVTATGGTPTYTYSWSPSGGTAATATGLLAGTYTVTVTDANGCSKTASVTITQPEFMLAGNCVTTGVSCNGGTDGTATAVAVGGTAPYTYTWNTVPVQTGATVSGLAAGTYMVTVTDANGCTKTATCTITQPPVLLVSASKTNIVCNGAANGTATAIAGGGTPAYTYSWNTTPVQTTATATGLGAGSYIVTVTDANGCTATASVNILQPLPMTATITPNHVDCNGGSDGTASVAATGGTPLYSYSWNTVPVKTTATVTGLIAGTYTVTVTDSKGCTKTASVTITQPPVLNTTVTSTNVLCFGGTNGTGTATASGGTPPYTYQWAPCQCAGNNPVVSCLGAGTYTVTVTDSKGCTKTASVTITEPPVLTTIMATPTHVTCNGGTNGSASVAVSGGTSAYTYSWNTTPVKTTPTASGLGAGTYTVTVTDGNGCSKTASVTITQPPVLNATASATHINCFGAANGSATVAVNGGTPGYTYNWLPSGGTAATASNLTPGTYTVTVTDSKGCSKTASVTITQPAALNTTVTSTNVTCYGAVNGTATATPSGGTAPYTYLWAPCPCAGNTPTVSCLGPGTYTVTVTDANGCSKTGSVTISQPAAINLSVDTLGITCTGQTDGMIFASANTGATILVNGQPYDENTLYGPGTYTVTASMPGGNPGNPPCVASIVVTLHNPAPVTSTVVKTDAPCFGQMGTLNIAGSPGSVIFVDGMNTPPGLDLYPSGAHQVVVYSWNAQYSGICADTTNVTIGQPAQLMPSLTGNNVACFGGTTVLLASSTGGTPAYQFSLNGGAYQPIGIFAGVSASSNPYVVTVKDANNCTATASKLVTQSSSPCKTLGSTVTQTSNEPTEAAELKVYPNPSSGVFNIVLPGADNKVKLVVSDLNGKVIAAQSFDENHATLIRLELYNVAAGVYLLQVNDGDDVYRSKLIVE